MISVIVPVYNIEEYLPQCIESIIKQTYTELEIILVDDGSTDLSGNICDRYAVSDSRIKVIHKENGGLVSARKAPNCKIARAKNRYFITGVVSYGKRVSSSLINLYGIIKSLQK